MGEECGIDISRFHHINSRGNVTGVVDAEICDYIIETIPMFVCKRTPYLYINGVYQEDTGGILLKSKIQQLIMRDFIKAPTVKRIYDLIISQQVVQKQYQDLNRQPCHWVNFENGYFDVKSWEMHPHDPMYFTLNQIPYMFDPAVDIKDCPGHSVTAFLNSSLPDQEDQKTVWEYFGLCMTTETGFQKFMMMKGPGGTGKSVLIGLLETMIGSSNCASISLQDLNRRFYATGLYGKLLNACADIPSNAMQNIDVLKKAVGEDTILYEKKGQDPLKFKSYAKLIFSANEMPINLDEKTNAYYRRLLVIEMNRIVDEARKDPSLQKKLLLERDYLIRMSLLGLKRLYDQKKFTVSRHSVDCIEELYRTADSVKAFLDEKVEKKEDGRILRSNMFAAYTEFCEENDRKAHGRSAFFRMMEDKGYYLKHTSAGYFYEGVDFIQEDFVPVDWETEVPFK